MVFASQILYVQCNHVHILIAVGAIEQLNMDIIAVL